jgi:hypothetical protein
MIDFQDDSYEVEITNTLQEHDFLLPEEVESMVSYLRATEAS